VPLPFPDPPGPRSPPHVPVSPDTPSSSRTLTPSRGRYGLPRSLAVSRGDAGPTSRFPHATPGSFPCRVLKLDELSSAATFAFLPPSFRLHRRRAPGYAPSSLRGPGLRDAAALPDAAPSRPSRSCAPVPPSTLTPPHTVPSRRLEKPCLVASFAPVLRSAAVRTHVASSASSSKASFPSPRGASRDADGQKRAPVAGQDPPHRPPSTRTGSRREPSGRESPPRSSALRSPRCVRGWPYSPPSPLSGGRPCFNPFRNPPAAGRSASDTCGFTLLS